MPTNNQFDYHHTPNPEDNDELKGLLTDHTNPDRLEDQSFCQRSCTTRELFVATCAGLLLLSAGALISGFNISPFKLGHPLTYESTALLSNGTHDFRRTVLLVSIDGLRADYLDRELTPHLLSISKKGLRAKWMKPVFPTLTFPNHWALMTGLYAESHGIVGNNFWDPPTESEFHYNVDEISLKPHWWLGEPMWETAEKAGLKSANLMWPGPAKTTTGVASTHHVPFKNKVPLSDKLNQLLQWIDLPLEERPQLIMAYEPSLDQAGHKWGPMSRQVNETLKYVDTFAKDLLAALAERNLEDIVDIVFVSDHGMVDTSRPIPVMMEDVIGPDGLLAIEHEDGWPSKGIRFRPGTNETLYIERVKAYAEAHPQQLSFYTHETMPKRYHFTNNIRIAPYYIVPKIEFILTNKNEGDVGFIKGNHGFDNEEPAMHAMFVAHGPFTNLAKANQQQALRARQNAGDDGWHSVSDDAYVMKGFQNVEIYGLVMKLLGIPTSKWASNNSTRDFWDRYL